MLSILSSNSHIPAQISKYTLRGSEVPSGGFLSHCGTSANANVPVVIVPATNAAIMDSINIVLLVTDHTNSN